MHLRVLDVVKLLCHSLGHHVQTVKVNHLQFASRHLGILLVYLPAVQSADGIEVGETHYVIIACEVGLIYSCYAERARPYLIVAQEIHENLFSDLQPQLVCHILRNEQLLGTLVHAQAGHLSLYQVRGQERGIVVLSYPLEHHTEEIIVCLQYTLFLRVPLYPFYSLCLLYILYQLIVGVYRVRLVKCVERHVVGHYDVRTESYHLVADGVFETRHHADTDYHHRNTQGHTQHGYRRLGPEMSRYVK